MVSSGCSSCYAMRQANRWSGAGQPYEGLTRMTEHGPVWTGKIRVVPEALEEPLRWRTPKGLGRPLRIFVNSMSDLFHEDVPDEFIDAVFGVMAACSEHTFQILTKRPERMLAYVQRLAKSIEPLEKAAREMGYTFKFRGIGGDEHGTLSWPIPNVHLGVSVENQETANERIPLLLKTPAAVRFLSVEPLLEAVNLFAVPDKGTRVTEFSARNTQLGDLNWVIVGGESGPGARPCNIEWIRGIVRQCQAAAVPVFVKQLGSRPTDGHVPIMVVYPDGELCCGGGAADALLALKDRKGGNMTEWPEDLRIREFPA